jgi:hypothetical protein
VSSSPQTSAAWPAWLEMVRRLSDDPGLAEVGVSAAWSGKTAGAFRDLLYGGQLTSTDDIRATGVAREETSTLDVAVTALVPGAEAVDAIERARQIGAVLETLLASDPALSNVVPGFLWTQVASWTQDYELTDDAVIGIVLYKIEFHCYLR